MRKSKIRARPGPWVLKGDQCSLVVEVIAQSKPQEAITRPAGRTQPSKGNCGADVASGENGFDSPDSKLSTGGQLRVK